MEYTTVKVTSDDIRNGMMGDPSCCPVALALRRQADFKKANVHANAVFGEGPWMFVLPGKVRKFISDFDSGADVKPFSFKMPLRKQIRVSPCIAG